jgi:hypothetical protein
VHWRSRRRSELTNPRGAYKKDPRQEHIAMQRPDESAYFLLITFARCAGGSIVASKEDIAATIERAHRGRISLLVPRTFAVSNSETLQAQSSDLGCDWLSRLRNLGRNLAQRIHSTLNHLSTLRSLRPSAWMYAPAQCRTVAAGHPDPTDCKARPGVFQARMGPRPCVDDGGAAGTRGPRLQG